MKILGKVDLEGQSRVTQPASGPGTSKGLPNSCGSLVLGHLISWVWQQGLPYWLNTKLGDCCVLLQSALIGSAVPVYWK